MVDERDPERDARLLLEAREEIESLKGSLFEAGCKVQGQAQRLAVIHDDYDRQQRVLTKERERIAALEEKLTDEQRIVVAQRERIAALEADRKELRRRLFPHAWNKDGTPKAEENKP